MTFKIIKNAPPPPSSRVGRIKYPFDEMEVGDAFDVPLKSGDRIRAAASQWGKDHGKKFTIRKIDAETFRVWRIA